MSSAHTAEEQLDQAAKALCGDANGVRLYISARKEQHRAIQTEELRRRLLATRQSAQQLEQIYSALLKTKHGG